MKLRGGINSKIFFRYSESDVFQRASAKFLFYVSLVFFCMMFALFFINMKEVGVAGSFLASGTSCMSAVIAMILIVRGRVRAAGTLLSVLQSVILLASGYTRTPELTMMTITFFAFPTIVLATIFATGWVHAIIVVYITVLVVLNFIRFNSIPVVTVPPEILHNMMLRSTIIFILTSLLIYALSYVTLRSMRLSLKISNDEARVSKEKNEYIMELIDTIRRSYNDLTEAMARTDHAISGIFLNIQTEAATIEELVASIEEISSSTTSVEETCRNQNESVSELSASINLLSELIDSLQVFGKELQSEFFTIKKMAEEGKYSSSSLGEVNRKTLLNSGNIQSIAAIIDDFFDKINLLSLNAAIEAARAGEQGRGFAVVADEIGKLADNSSSELKKIRELTEKNRSDVEFSSSIIENIIKFIESLSASLNNMQVKAVGTLDVIARQKELQDAMLTRNRTVHEKSDIIKDSSTEQSVAIQEIARSIESTNSLVQENTGNAQSLRESYDKLKDISEKLKVILNEKS